MKTQSSKSLTYRADIDGLRTVAVFAVVIFHMNQVLLKGGFLGVDIFFVISGFLITKLLLNAAEIGQPILQTLKEFYERRILRIMPLFMFVLFFSIAAAYFIFLPDDFLVLLRSAEYATTFGSNIFFGSSFGYFDRSNELSPFLHTWSLSIEEQFYFAWPILILGFFAIRQRGGKRNLSSLNFAMIAFLGIIGLVSISQYLSISMGTAAYYSFTARAFEPMLGAVLALQLARNSSPLQLSVWALNTLGMIFFSGLILSFVYFGAYLNLPGVVALLPCLSAAGLIWLGAQHRQVLLTKILSCRILVWLGKRSYSIYLIHWPILCFARYCGVIVVGSILKETLYIASTLLVSAATYSLVEQRVRHQKYSLAVSICAFVLLPIALSFGAFQSFSKEIGPNKQFSEQYKVKLKATMQAANEIYEPCHTSVADLTPEAPCLLGIKKEMAVNGILWGDSHANHFGGFVDELAKQMNLTIRMISQSSCSSVFFEGEAGICSERNRNVLSLLEHDPSLKIVFMSSAWYYLFPVDSPSHNAFSEQELRGTIERLLDLGKVVVAIEDSPAAPLEKMNCPLKKAYFKDAIEISCDFDDAAGVRDRQVEAVFASIRRPNFYILNTVEMICREGRCNSELDGVPLFRHDDMEHLNDPASHLLGVKFARQNPNQLLQIEQSMRDRH